MRWRVSDVFDAIANDESLPEFRRRCAARVAEWARYDAASGFLHDGNVGRWLFWLGPVEVALGENHGGWTSRTAEERCAAVVREARRLNVPRRA